MSFTVYFTFGYALLSLCLIAPPTEFVSGGVTVQNMFSRFLGSEEINFIDYHIKRTSLTWICHTLLPFGYPMLLAWFEGDISIFDFGCNHMWWKIYLTSSIAFFISIAIRVLYWSMDDWRNHPIAIMCAFHSLSRERPADWRQVANAVNAEFGRHDKFSSGHPGRRLYITNSWILQTSTYTVFVAHQSDIVLSLSDSRHHELYVQGVLPSVGVQFLTIRVTSANPGVPNFTIRLNATDFGDLKDRLSRPIENARNLVIQQSLSDRFLEAFTSEIEKNPRVFKQEGEELDKCIGCMQRISCIKLTRQCEGSECEQCFCRPMWCDLCMGRWFASRQPQNEPQRWMSGVSPCPTCRAIFCILDACYVD